MFIFQQNHCRRSCADKMRREIGWGRIHEKKILFLLLLGAALSARADEPFVSMYRHDDTDGTARVQENA